MTIVQRNRSLHSEASATLDPNNWDDIRAQGHRMLDDMLDYIEHIRMRPVWQPIPDAVRERFRDALPSAPMDLAAGQHVHVRFIQLPEVACATGDERDDAARREVIQERAADQIRRKTDLRVQWGGAGHDGVKRGQVVVVDHRVLGERDGNRRRDERNGALVVLDIADEVPEVEARHDHQPGPCVQGGIEQHSHSVDVEERQHGEDRVVGDHAVQRPDLRDVGHEVAVCQHHALGVTGRPRAVRQHRQM